MADPHAPVDGLHDLVAHFDRGCKPDPSDWRIGTEHEKFGFRLSDNGPLPYADPTGGPDVKSMLEGLVRFGWTPGYEADTIIALKRAGASITLEPGGQFELSGAPLETLHQTCAEVHTHLTEVREGADEIGAGFLGLGFSPIWSLETTPIMPKARYGIMRAYMPKVGSLGREMMFRSCTVQTNLDFASEADMVKKFRVSLALQPIATALFANSPFKDGGLSGKLSFRAHVWTDTDPDRTGTLPFVFEDGFDFERYARWALDAPMYFVRRNGVFLDASGQSFRDFLDGRLPALPGERPSLEDWEDHLSTLFPEVRLKTFLEMRGADSGPWSNICALPALWVGLLYDSSALDAAWDVCKGWDLETRERLRADTAQDGLKARIGKFTVQDIAQEVLAIARTGLQTRAKAGKTSSDETEYLDHLDDIAQSGLTRAERLIEAYRGDWGEDLNRVFQASAY
ncbi:MAG: glutamate--cysteine ligase [Maricaulaceae bacterium]